MQNERTQQPLEDHALALRELLNRVRKGDQKAFDALLAQYDPLLSASVSSALRKIGSFSDYEGDDLRQEAIILFYNAALNFDAEQTEVEFGLYAKICLENGLTSLVRRIWKLRQTVCAADALPENYESLNGSSDPAQAVIEKESRDALYAFIEDNLSAYEFRIWQLFLSGYTAKEIADRMQQRNGDAPDESVSVKSVTNAIYRVRRKLRSLLQGS